MHHSIQMLLHPSILVSLFLLMKLVNASSDRTLAPYFSKKKPDVDTADKILAQHHQTHFKTITCVSCWMHFCSTNSFILVCIVMVHCVKNDWNDLIDKHCFNDINLLSNMDESNKWNRTLRKCMPDLLMFSELFYIKTP